MGLYDIIYLVMSTLGSTASTILQCIRPLKINNIIFWLLIAVRRIMAIASYYLEKCITGAVPRSNRPQGDNSCGRLCPFHMAVYPSTG